MSSIVCIALKTFCRTFFIKQVVFATASATLLGIIHWSKTSWVQHFTFSRKSQLLQSRGKFLICQEKNKRLLFYQALTKICQHQLNRFWILQMGLVNTATLSYLFHRCFPVCGVDAGTISIAQFFVSHLIVFQKRQQILCPSAI